MGCVLSSREHDVESPQGVDDTICNRYAILRSHSGRLQREGNDEDQGTTDITVGTASGIASKTCRPKGQQIIDLYCSSIAPSSKDQDRFITVPDFLPGLFFSGVFDGHAQNGGRFAERAAVALPKLMAKKIEWFANATSPESSVNRRDGEEDPDLLECKERIEKDIEDVFLSFQATLSEEYDAQVKTPLEKARIEMEAKEGIKLPICLPMLGGTTATTLVAASEIICVSWVGDSRGVLCCVDPHTGEVSARDLTVDHNVESNESERDRAEKAGGAVVGLHIAVDEADGMIQTLRSLGDVPHHRNRVVSEVPEVTVVRLNPQRHAFIVLASDGIWHHMSSDECVKKLYQAITDAATSAAKIGSGLTHEMLLGLVNKFEEDLESSIGERKGNKDDIVMTIATVRGYKWI